MNSLDLHMLMRDAGVDQQVIDVACKENNRLLKLEADRLERERQGKLWAERVESRLAAERDEKVEQLLASKPKAVHWSNEEDDGRRIDLGQAGLHVQNISLAQLRHQAEQTAVEAVMFELTGGLSWQSHKEWEERARAKWPKEIARAARRIERAFVRGSLRDLADAVRCTAGIPLVRVPREKVLERVGEVYDQLVVRSVTES